MGCTKSFHERKQVIMEEIMGRKSVFRIGIVASALAISASLAFFAGGFCGCSNEAAIQAKAEQPSEDVQEISPKPGDTNVMSPSETALEQARNAGLPVLLNFHSNQCIPCIEIEKVIEEVEPEYAGRVAFVIVDVYDEREYDLCMEYGVQTIPTTVFLDAQGEVVEGYVGVIDAAFMREILDRLVSGTSE